MVVGVGLLLAMGGGCCLLIAVPNFVKFGARSKQSEVKSNLKSVFTAEKSYFAENDVYDERIDAVGFAPERGNRYTYVLSPRGDFLVQGAPDGGTHTAVWTDERMAPLSASRTYLGSVPSGLMSEAGVHCDDDGGCWVTAFAVGNIDGDAKLDVWSISTRERVIGSETVMPGVPFMHVNDLD